ncbi:hypothetical protein QBC39DRAFT_344308, partial [Podospora conica]
MPQSLDLRRAEGPQTGHSQEGDSCPPVLSFLTCFVRHQLQLQVQHSLNRSSPTMMLFALFISAAAAKAIVGRDPTVTTHATPVEITQRAVDPTSIFDGDVWSWSNLPTTPLTTDTWSTKFDSWLSELTKLPPRTADAIPTARPINTTSDAMPTGVGFGTAATSASGKPMPSGDAWSTRSVAPFSNNTSTVLSTTTLVVTMTRPKETHHVTLKSTPSGMHWSYGTRTDITTLITPPSFSTVTRTVRARQTTGVPKKGCVNAPACGADTDSCIKSGTTCSINAELTPSNDHCKAACTCVCK